MGTVVALHGEDAGRGSQRSLSAGSLVARHARAATQRTGNDFRKSRRHRRRVGRFDVVVAAVGLVLDDDLHFVYPHFARRTTDWRQNACRGRRRKPRRQRRQELAEASVAAVARSPAVDGLVRVNFFGWSVLQTVGLNSGGPRPEDFSNGRAGGREVDRLAPMFALFALEK